MKIRKCYLNTLQLNDRWVIQCIFRLVSQFSLTLSLGNLFTETCHTAKRWPSDIVKEILS